MNIKRRTPNIRRRLSGMPGRVERRNEENLERLDERSQTQQVAERSFDFRHLGGAEFAHAVSQLVMIETGKTLQVHR